MKSKRVRATLVMCVEKGGVGLEKRHLCFYFVLRTRPSTRRDAKTQSHEFIRSNTCFAKELQSIIKEFSELKESEIYRKASKPTVPWWICVQRHIIG